ncbi:MAG TPA: protein kinase family protein, partial [Micromonosporaceae bacterium]|nr:protein kinase family protein [Micromonosporaceae bacterium]
MTQIGEGHEAAETAPPVITFGAPTLGEVLAERYQLEEHINDDSAGRQVWRGIDVILRRPVAVVLRYPGGDSAAEMLQAAVAASRVVHSNLVGVYDAIDEGDRAYVVREWVEGSSLREVVAAEGTLDAGRATSIVHAVSAAVAAVHATGMVHGNIHPGTVLIAGDGRVVLADARADDEATTSGDVRCLGAVLYFALTGYWPHAEAPCATSLPDAVRDTAGAIAAPRQMRAGVPAYVDDLAMDLLDPRLSTPAADVLTAELSRLDGPPEEHFFDDTGPLRYPGEAGIESEEAPEDRRSGSRRIALILAGLVVVIIVTTLFALSVIVGGGPNDQVATPPGGGSPDPTPPGTSAPGAAAAPKSIPIGDEQVRIIDPDGRRDELDDVAFVVDGDEETGWKTDHYRGSSKFGGIKQGMGILIDLGEARNVTNIQVQFTAPGATAQMRYGTADPAP